METTLTNSNQWQRLFLALVSGSFLLAGFAVTFFDSLGGNSQQFIAGTLLKVGFVLGLAWIAAPQLEHIGWHRLRGSMLAGVIVVVILMATRPRLGAIAGSLLVAASLSVTILGWIRSFTKPPRRS